MDNVEISSLQYIPHGFKVTQPKPSSLLLEIPTMHHEIELNIASSDVTIKAPSSIYKNKLEGLCGEYGRYLAASFLFLL